MKTKIIQLNPVNNYGNIIYRPDNVVAEIFCKIIGKKTIQELYWEDLKQLGFSVKIRGKHYLK